MMDEETRRDIVEAKETLERVDQRWVLRPGSARVHLIHALMVLKRILDKHAENEA